MNYLNPIKITLKTILLLVAGLMISNQTSAQCNGGTISPAVDAICSGDSVLLTVTGQGPNVMWQTSLDTVTWVDQNDTLDFLALANVTQTTYVRVSSVPAGCPTQYSSIAAIGVAATPVVTLTNVAGGAVTVTWSPFVPGVSYTIAWNGAGTGSQAVATSPFTITALSPNTNLCVQISPASLPICSGVISGQACITTIPPCIPPSLTATTTNATCAGFDGAIIVSVTGPNQPFNYIWSNGAFFPNNTNLAPGTYCLTVTDAAGCTASGCYTVGQSGNMQVALSSIDDSTGTWTIASTISGGSAPYLWSWDNGASTSTLTSVNAGIYCLTVVDANGCSAESCLTVGNSANTIAVNGVLINTNGLTVPVSLSADGVPITVNTSPNGSFTATVVLSNIFDPVFISFVDCNGNLVNDSASITLGTMNINYTGYYCTSQDSILINGQLDNTNGTNVIVSITTDAITLQNVTTDNLGLFTLYTVVNDITNSIGISFTDCNGLVVNDEVFADSNTNSVSYSADYCQTLPPSCDSMFTATYCTCDTAFTLEMDSATQALGVPYMWDFGDGNIDSTTLYPVHTYAVSGIYNVCLFTMTPGNFCSYCHGIGIDSAGNIVTRMDLAGFIIKIVPFGTTGVDHVTPNQSFDIYPNPLDGDGTLSLYSDKAKTYTINIINSLGQRIRTVDVNAQAGRNTFQLPVQDLADGLYMMTIDFESKQISRSFVK